MFATAAVVDAKRKEDRRQQWNRAIEEVKAGSEITSTTFSNTSRQAEPNLYQTVHTIPKGEFLSNFKPMAHEDSVVRLDVGSTSLKSDLERSGCSKDRLLASDSRHYEPTSSQTRQLLDVIEAHIKQIEGITQKNASITCHDTTSIHDANIAPQHGFTHREPILDIHLRRMEQMVAKLVVKLLLTTVSPHLSASNTLGKQIDALKLGADCVEGLDKDNWAPQFPAYSDINIVGMRERREQLHRALNVITDAKDFGKMETNAIIAKLCYNMLVSAAPPSITTYDILLQRLTKMKLHDQARVVVDSFWEDSKFKPTQRTVVLLLNHYSAVGDLKGFNKTISRMRVAGSSDSSLNNMRVSRRHQSLLTKASVQQWASTVQWRLVDGFVVQKVSRDREVFDSLVNGCLDFVMPTRAVMYARAAFREGLELSVGTFERLIRYLSFQNNRKTAREFLTYIVTNFHHFSSAVERLYHPLRQLISLCDVKVDFISGEYSDLPAYIDRASFNGMLRRLSKVHAPGAPHGWDLLKVESDLTRLRRQAKDHIRRTLKAIKSQEIKISINHIESMISGSARWIERADKKIFRLKTRQENRGALPSLENVGVGRSIRLMDTLITASAYNMDMLELSLVDLKHQVQSKEQKISPLKRLEAEKTPMDEQTSSSLQLTNELPTGQAKVTRVEKAAPRIDCPQNLRTPEDRKSMTILTAEGASHEVIDTHMPSSRIRDVYRGSFAIGSPAMMRDYESDPAYRSFERISQVERLAMAE